MIGAEVTEDQNNQYAVTINTYSMLFCLRCILFNLMPYCGYSKFVKLVATNLTDVAIHDPPLRSCWLL